MIKVVIRVPQKLKAEILCSVVGCSSPGLRCVHLPARLLRSQDQAAIEGKFRSGR